MNRLRYVVLLHSGVGREHFDLLIDPDQSEPLLSWRLDEWPPTDHTTAETNEVHRRIYLTYEGPVGGDRGRVRRVAEGFCDLLPEDNQHWICSFNHAPNANALRPILLPRSRAAD